AKKGKWEYMGNESILIDKHEESILFKHGFLDENILALKMDSVEEYAVFVNENKYAGDLNTIDKVIEFLNDKYLHPTIKSKIETSAGFEKNQSGPTTKTYNSYENQSQTETGHSL